MKNEFTAILEPPQGDDGWWVARCPEVPPANGQGKTEAECLESLTEAIELVLAYQRDEAMKRLSPHASTRTVQVA